jgi:hypothetical protein
MVFLDSSKGPAGGSSDFLGDPPPDPRFLASLGALSCVELSLSYVSKIMPLHSYLLTVIHLTAFLRGIPPDPPGSLRSGLGMACSLPLANFDKRNGAFVRIRRTCW